MSSSEAHIAVLSIICDTSGDGLYEIRYQNIHISEDEYTPNKWWSILAAWERELHLATFSGAAGGISIRFATAGSSEF